jgi:hypothetical protein
MKKPSTSNEEIAKAGFPKKKKMIYMALPSH